MRRTSSFLFVVLMAAAAPAVAGDPKGAPVPAAKPAPKKAPPPPVKKAPPPVTAEHKKALADFYGGFKFGMTKDDVLAALTKQLDAQYADRLKATTDTAVQDRLRAEKKNEIAVISKSYVAFDGKKVSGWDVSIIEDEFMQRTNESMIERWENKDGKNQRRFFFFYEGKLWKMFIQLDVSILPAEAKNFETFAKKMQEKYGPGDSEGATLTWRTDEFEVRATAEKLRTYDSLGIVIADPKAQKDVLALREKMAPKKAETSTIIKAVIDVDGKDTPDVKSGGTSAVDAVIRAQGGGGTAPKK
ncbi:MAG: hypothetical protein KIT31_27965 [Deltaproteobacteria bacterium]|nr:hypothetical protein [Deltaproteobacteria bacterium]